jgi:hypothetical protein
MNKSLFSLLFLITASLHAEPFTQWKYQNDGTSNVHTYESTRLIPKGSELRIRIVKQGEGHIRIENKNEFLKEFPDDECKKGNILKYTLRRGQKVRVASGFTWWTNQPGWHKKKKVQVREDYHRMTFKDGLVIDVKVHPEDF